MRLDITGVVLAGGRSSRMGKDKASMPINDNGTIFLQHAVNILSEIFVDIIVIANKEYPVNVPIYSDIYHDKGPIGGIYTALTKTNKKGIFVAACDMPYLTPQIIGHIIANSKEDMISVPTLKGLLQPLASYYPVEVTEYLGHYMNSQGRALRGFIERTGHIKIPIPPVFADDFLNINTPQEFNDYQIRRMT